MSSRKGMWGLLAGLGLLAAVVAACGGGSSSNTGPTAGGGGGSSGAVVQGQIIRARSAALQESAVVVVLRTALGIGLAEAAPGDPVGGVTVELRTFPGGTLVDTTTTSAQGNFIFTNVQGGQYTIDVVGKVEDPTSKGISSDPFIVGAGDVATISGQVTESFVLIPPGQVHVVAVDVADLPQNFAQLCHAVSVASASGANLADVIAFRLNGNGGHPQGWGNVAKHYNVSPSVLGNKSCAESQISEASAIASGHGKKKGQS